MKMGTDVAAKDGSVRFVWKQFFVLVGGPFIIPSDPYAAPPTSRVSFQHAERGIARTAGQPGRDSRTPLYCL